MVVFVHYLGIPLKQLCDPVYESLQNTYTGSERGSRGAVKTRSLNAGLQYAACVKIRPDDYTLTSCLRHSI
jgi:hypothetical protein